MTILGIRLFYCQQKSQSVIDLKKCSIIYYIMYIYVHISTTNLRVELKKPNCLKCKNDIGTWIHCLWECIHIQFWGDVCDHLSGILGQGLNAEPLLCLLGVIPTTLEKYKKIIHPLLMLARKAIMIKWVGDQPPTTTLWKSLIGDLVSMEKLSFLIKGDLQSFSTIWSEPLRLLGLTPDSSTYPWFKIQENTGNMYTNFQNKMASKGKSQYSPGQKFCCISGQKWHLLITQLLIS